MKKWITSALLILCICISIYGYSWYIGKDYIFSKRGKDVFDILVLSPEKFKEIQNFKDKGYKSRLGISAYSILNTMIETRNNEEFKEEREILLKVKKDLDHLNTLEDTIHKVMVVDERGKRTETCTYNPTEEKGYCIIIVR